MKNLLFPLLLCILFTKLHSQSGGPIEQLKKMNALMENASKADNYPLAIDYAKQCVDFASKHFPEGDTFQINALHNYGYQLMMASSYNEADIVLDKALKLAEKYKRNHLEIIRSQAMNCYYSGNYELAEVIYKKAIKLQEQDPNKDPAEYANLLNNLAVMYAEQKRYEESEPLYLLAMKLRKDAFGTEHPYYGQSLNNLAVLYKNTKRYKEAETYYLENLRIQKKASASSYAKTLNNFALYYAALGQYEKALPMLEEATQARKSIYGTEHPEYAHATNNLGRCYEQLGNFKKAEQCFLDAIAIREKTLLPNHHDVLDGYNNIIFLYYILGKKEEMNHYIIKSLKANAGKDDFPSKIDAHFFEVVLKTEFSYPAGVFSSLSIFFKEQKLKIKENPKDIATLELAQKIIDAAIAIENKMRQSFRSDADKLRALSEYTLWTERGIEVTSALAKMKNMPSDDALMYAERNKSHILLNAMKAQRARSFGDLPDSLAQKELGLQKELDLLKKQLLEIKDEAKRAEKLDQFNHTTEAAENFKKRIEKQYPKYFKLKYAPDEFNAKDIQKLLRNDAALVEYYVGDSMLFVFTLTGKELFVQQLDIDLKTFREKVKALRRALSDHEFIKNNEEEAFEQYIQTAFWAYQKLLQPAITNLKGIKKLIIVPDAELGHIPFEALLTEEVKIGNAYKDLPYVLNQYSVSYDYSAMLWKENMEQKAKKHNGKIYAAAAAYGVAAMDSLRAPKVRDQQLLKLRDALQDLPAARKEVESLSGLLSGKFALGKAANEADFKALAGEYAIIHLAMHGLLNTQYPILSSLAFTENEDSTEDNFLQAYEISHLNLNAEMVVLSACETGYGKFQQGEGVMSLARSFMYAGVPSLVVSLWQVNDASTSEIMQHFYKNLNKGLDKADALRQAKLDYIKGSLHENSQHPVFWAAFIQLGDSRPLHLRQKMSTQTQGWVWGLGAATLLLLGAWALWRNRSKG